MAEYSVDFVASAAKEFRSLPADISMLLLPARFKHRPVNNQGTQVKMQPDAE